MPITPRQWLSEPWIGRLPFDDIGRPTIPDAPTPTRLQVLAALISINRGSLHMRGYGFISSGPDCGPYGRFGLEQQEAFVLMEMGAYFSGLIDASPSDPSIDNIFDEEWARVEAARKKEPH